MNPKKVNIQKFEKLTTGEQGQLIGGFSKSSSGISSDLKNGVNLIKCTITNNCEGGNCVSGCGG